MHDSYARLVGRFSGLLRTSSSTPSFCHGASRLRCWVMRSQRREKGPALQNEASA